jgi:hypothetical protein
VIVEDQSEVIAFLSRPEAYGRGAAGVDRIETHISVVFLCGDRAFKLKRAVRLPYLDFSTADRRRRFCRAEVRINRRTAPAIYRRVVAVTREPDGALRLGGGGRPLDWLVEMVRFDQATLFDRLAREGRLDRFVIEDLADSVARFHGEAEPRLRAGGRRVIARVLASNNKCFAALPEGTLAAETVEQLATDSRQALAAAAALLETRRRAGFVRHCHGDLHLRNIFLHDGKPTLFDAIEFSADLAAIDVLYDLAFLVMDLDYRNLREFANLLLNRYLDATGDVEGLAALPLFLSLRAAIRSHVQAAAAGCQTDPEKTATLEAEALRYLDLALAYLVPRSPCLIAVGGVSGSGKSRLARGLAPLFGAAPGARIVRSDSTRKRLAGVALGERLAAEFYSPEMNERTYARVYEECRQVVATGRPVIADAVFSTPGEREAIERVAVDSGVPFRGLWLEASPAQLEDRVTRRRRNVSDATAEVVRMQLARDPGTIGWDRIDTSGPAEESLARARKLLGQQ